MAKHIEINIWKACNNKCRFCMSSRVWKEEKKFTSKSKIFDEISNYSNNW